MIPAGDIPPVHSVVECNRVKRVSLANTIVPVPGFLISGCRRPPAFAPIRMAVTGRGQNKHDNGNDDRGRFQTLPPRETRKTMISSPLNSVHSAWEQRSLRPDPFLQILPRCGGWRAIAAFRPAAPAQPSRHRREAARAARLGLPGPRR